MIVQGNNFVIEFINFAVRGGKVPLMSTVNFAEVSDVWGVGKEKVDESVPICSLFHDL